MLLPMLPVVHLLEEVQAREELVQVDTLEVKVEVVVNLEAE